jgi:hypothetical protein
VVLTQGKKSFFADILRDFIFYSKLYILRVYSLANKGCAEINNFHSNDLHHIQ